VDAFQLLAQSIHPLLKSLAWDLALDRLPQHLIFDDLLAENGSATVKQSSRVKTI